MERIEMNNPSPESMYNNAPITDNFELFKAESGNSHFEVHMTSYLAAAAILFLFIQSFFGDPETFLKSMDDFIRMVAYISTIILQWGIVGIIILASYKEKTGLKGLGLERIQAVDFAWGMAILGSMFVAGLFLAVVLTAMGYPPNGDIQLLLPQNLSGKITWVFVSFTAGFCEEVIFRGYIMTRVRLLMKSKSWLIPTVVSAFFFGIPHFYQGVHGIITITVIGLILSLYFIYIKRLWPLIIAHFFLDFLAIIIPVDF